MAVNNPGFSGKVESDISPKAVENSTQAYRVQAQETLRSNVQLEKDAQFKSGKPPEILQSVEDSLNRRPKLDKISDLLNGSDTTPNYIEQLNSAQTEQERQNILQEISQNQEISQLTQELGIEDTPRAIEKLIEEERFTMLETIKTIDEMFDKKRLQLDMAYLENNVTKAEYQTQKAQLVQDRSLAKQAEFKHLRTTLTTINTLSKAGIFKQVKKSSSFVKDFYQEVNNNVKESRQDRKELHSKVDAQVEKFENSKSNLNPQDVKDLKEMISQNITGLNSGFNKQQELKQSNLNNKILAIYQTYDTHTNQQDISTKSQVKSAETQLREISDEITEQIESDELLKLEQELEIEFQTQEPKISGLTATQALLQNHELLVKYQDKTNIAIEEGIAQMREVLFKNPPLPYDRRKKIQDMFNREVYTLRLKQQMFNQKIENLINEKNIYVLERTDADNISLNKFITNTTEEYKMLTKKIKNSHTRMLQETQHAYQEFANGNMTYEAYQNQQQISQKTHQINAHNANQNYKIRLNQLKLQEQQNHTEEMNQEDITATNRKELQEAQAETVAMQQQQQATGAPSSVTPQTATPQLQTA